MTKSLLTLIDHGIDRFRDKHAQNPKAIRLTLNARNRMICEMQDMMNEKIEELTSYRQIPVIVGLLEVEGETLDVAWGSNDSFMKIESRFK